jgi:hypothetical protein
MNYVVMRVVNTWGIKQINLEDGLSVIVATNPIINPLYHKELL